MNKDTKRTEKIASALYLLTGFFDDKEPMKWQLRDLAGQLVTRGEVGNTVLEVISLLNVAKNAGLISDTNFGIIFGQLAIIAPQKIDDLLKLEEPTRTSEAVNTHIYAENKPRKETLYISSSVQSAPAIKDKLSKIHHEPKENGAVAVKKNSRQETILGLLKKKSEIHVSDVAPLIPGVSEKTIQRELLTMVSKGILRKEGEKRWSRYSLAE